MDPALARLVTDTNCRTSGPQGGVHYNPTSGFRRCGLDNLAFAHLVAQYGAVIAPTAMKSARTTGFGGFELTLGANFTTIDSNARYWQEGTQGPVDPTSRLASVRNREPPGVLQHYELKIRRGFPFGLELSGNFGYVAQTSIFTIGADVRLSILEGFRTGVPAFFPEFSVGGAVRTTTGTDQMQLTVAGADAQLSKPIPIAGTVIITPYVSYQWFHTFGDSGLIDLTPNTDAINLCGYQGTKNPYYTKNQQPNDGQPICSRGGTSADFNNTAVFDPVRVNRHRLGGGFQMRIQMVRFGAHLIRDLISPEAANSGKEVNDPADPSRKINKFAGVNAQWTFGFDLGAIF